MSENNAVPAVQDLPALPSQEYQSNDLMLVDIPESVLKEAQSAASALKDVISRKQKKVMFNGEQYLEFEDWQTVGRFYGVTAKIISTNPVEFGGVSGFEARAVAIRVVSGQEISAAEAMCLTDEKNWASKPLFQLRSMAQTRACAKALRNVLAWVVVLAGYRPTPAEEILSMEKKPVATSQSPQRKPDVGNAETISEAQGKRFYAIACNAGLTDEQMKDYLFREYGIEHSRDILRSDYEKICQWAQGQAEPGANG